MAEHTPDTGHIEKLTQPEVTTPQVHEQSPVSSLLSEIVKIDIATIYDPATRKLTNEGRQVAKNFFSTSLKDENYYDQKDLIKALRKAKKNGGLDPALAPVVDKLTSSFSIQAENKRKKDIQTEIQEVPEWQKFMKHLGKPIIDKDGNTVIAIPKTATREVAKRVAKERNQLVNAVGTAAIPYDKVEQVIRVAENRSIQQQLPILEEVASTLDPNKAVDADYQTAAIYGEVTLGGKSRLQVDNSEFLSSLNLGIATIMSQHSEIHIGKAKPEATSTAVIAAIPSGEKVNNSKPSILDAPSIVADLEAVRIALEKAKLQAVVPESPVIGSPLPAHPLVTAPQLRGEPRSRFPNPKTIVRYGRRALAMVPLLFGLQNSGLPEAIQQLTPQHATAATDSFPTAHLPQREQTRIDVSPSDNLFKDQQLGQQGFIQKITAKAEPRLHSRALENVGSETNTLVNVNYTVKTEKDTFALSPIVEDVSVVQLPETSDEVQAAENQSHTSAEIIKLPDGNDVLRVNGKDFAYEERHLATPSGKPLLEAYNAVLHFTTAPVNDEFQLNYLSGNNERGVCTQYLIGRDGKIYKLFDDIEGKLPMTYTDLGTNPISTNIEMVALDANDILDIQKEAAAALLIQLEHTYGVKNVSSHDHANHISAKWLAEHGDDPRITTEDDYRILKNAQGEQAIHTDDDGKVDPGVENMQAIYELTKAAGSTLHFLPQDISKIQDLQPVVQTPFEDIAVSEMKAQVETTRQLTEIERDMWKLVDKDHKLPDNFKADTVLLRDHNIPVTAEDRAAHPALIADLRNMFAIVQQQGIDMLVGSAERDIKRQKEIYTGSPAQAEPGTSQHHTGFALDFTSRGIGERIDTSAGFENTQASAFLTEHAWEYGFVLSYTHGHDGKPNESWHYYYVGKDLAKAVRDLKGQGWDGDLFAVLQNIEQRGVIPVDEQGKIRLTPDMFTEKST